MLQECQAADPSRKPMGPLREVKRYYRIDRRQIAYFRFLLEAYDGLAVVSTLDPRQGRVVLYLSESRQPELDEFLDGIAGILWLEPSAPENPDNIHDE